MASSITPYDQLWKLTTNGLNLQTATLKVRLVTSSYTFSAAHTAWDNGANNSTDPSFNEVATGSGYTTGGITLANVVISAANLKYDNVTWSTLTKTFRAAIIVAIGTYGSVTDPVLAYLLPDSTPADIVSNGSDYSVIWNATDGLFYRPA